MHYHSSVPSKNHVKPKKKRGCLFRILIGCLVLFILLGGSALYVKYRIGQSWLPVDRTSDEQISVQIPSGSGVASIAQLLADQRLVQNASSFVLYCRLNQLDQRLQAGN